MADEELVFETGLYSPGAVQRAIYRLSDRLSADLQTDGDVLRCTVHIPIDDPARVAELLADLRNEALDEMLRERIRDQTELTRNVILSLAFSQSELTSSGDDGDEIPSSD